MVAIRFTNAAASSTMTLNVNDTGAKKLYQYGTALMSSGTGTSGWPAGAVVMFIYDETLDNDNGGWTRQFWSNTSEPTNIMTKPVDNINTETAANGGVGISRYVLEMMTANEKWSAIAHVNNSTASDQGTSSAKVASTADFLLTSPILYTTTNLYIAPNSVGKINGYAIGNINLRYSIGTTGTNVSFSTQYNHPIYLVGIPNSDKTTFKLDPTQWWAESLPTTNNGRIYIYLGLSVSTSNIYLSNNHPIYYHNGTSIVSYVPGYSTI